MSRKRLVATAVALAFTLVFGPLCPCPPGPGAVEGDGHGCCVPELGIAAAGLDCCPSPDEAPADAVPVPSAAAAAAAITTVPSAASPAVAAAPLRSHVPPRPPLVLRI